MKTTELKLFAKLLRGRTVSVTMLSNQAFIFILAYFG